MFNIGDRVRLVRGWTEMEIINSRTCLRSGRKEVQAAYVHNLDHEKAYDNTGGQYERRWRPVTDYVLWDGDDSNKPQPLEDQEIENMSTKLYQTKEETARFGTFLAINSAGQIVLEMKGSTAVEAFDKDKIEEVIPFTAQLVGVAGNTGSSHHQINKGEVEEGDLVLSHKTGNLYWVAKVDTKQKCASELGDYSVFKPTNR